MEGWEDKKSAKPGREFIAHSVELGEISEDEDHSEANTTANSRTFSRRVNSWESALGGGFSVHGRRSRAMSNASSRAADFNRKMKTDRHEALSPLERQLDRMRTAGGYTDVVPEEVHYIAPEEVHCNIIAKGDGLPLAGFVEEAVEKAIGGGAGPPDSFKESFEDGNNRIFHGVWELSFFLVVGSLLFAMWKYEGSSQSTTDLITVVASAAGSLGIVARSFSARAYLGVIYSAHVGSGIVSLRLVSACTIDAMYRSMGLGTSKGWKRNLCDAVALVVAFPVVVILAVSGLTKVASFLATIIVGSDNNGSWVMGKGIVRYGDTVMVVPVIEKRVAWTHWMETRKIQWPGGAWRTYVGGPPPSSWALHFSSRSSFLVELGCDKISIQFGVERRLILSIGSRTLSFVIATRDTRGGLLLLPAKDSAGVRVRIGVSAFSGATGGVTIWTAEACRPGPLSPEEEVAKALRLSAPPFCLDVSACGIGTRKRRVANITVLDVLDGAGAGSVTDRCLLWDNLHEMCFSTATASWAAGFFGGQFHSLHEHCTDHSVNSYSGKGDGMRCITLTPSHVGPVVDFSCYDVVLGLRVCEGRISKVPVYQRDELLPSEGYLNIVSRGIKGKYCLIPGGPQGKLKVFGSLEVQEAQDPDICEECLVGETSWARRPWLRLRSPYAA